VCYLQRGVLPNLASHLLVLTVATRDPPHMSCTIFPSTGPRVEVRYELLSAGPAGRTGRMLLGHHRARSSQMGRWLRCARVGLPRAFTPHRCCVAPLWLVAICTEAHVVPTPRLDPMCEEAIGTFHVALRSLHLSQRSRCLHI
jgi:hypothetical protein